MSLSDVMESEYIAAFFCAPYSEFDYIEKTLKEYDIGHYAIAFEELDSKGEPKPHFHVLFQGTSSIYNAFSKRLVEKYNLRRLGHGGKNKYGRVRNIRDLEKMLAYTIKDNTFRTTFTGTFLEQAIKTRFKKETTKSIVQEFIGYFRQKLSHHQEDSSAPLTPVSTDKRLIKTEIIKFLISKKMTPTRPKLKFYLYEYIIQEDLIPPSIKENFFIDLLIGDNSFQLDGYTEPEFVPDSEITDI